MMFELTANYDNEALLQGDIIKDIQFFGAIKESNLTKTESRGGRILNWGINSAPLMGTAIVLSHSCEISKENGVKLTSIVLAPLRNIQNATKVDKVRELIDSNYITESSPFSYLKYFYIEPNEKIVEFPEGCVVDFSKCYSIHKDSLESLISKKVLQLKPEIQDAFSLKLALFFYRNKQSV